MYTSGNSPDFHLIRFYILAAKVKLFPSSARKRIARPILMLILFSSSFPAANASPNHSLKSAKISRYVGLVSHCSSSWQNVDPTSMFIWSCAALQAGIGLSGCQRQRDEWRYEEWQHCRPASRPVLWTRRFQARLASIVQPPLFSPGMFG